MVDEEVCCEADEKIQVMQAGVYEGTKRGSDSAMPSNVQLLYLAPW